MLHTTANSIDKIYREICYHLLNDNNSHVVGNTRELNNYSFTLTDINNNIVNIRNISKSYLLGELTWYMTARNDIDFIHKFSTFWGRISDDGVTSNSAYGHILFKRHGFNQVEKIIDLLKSDPNSRRAVLNFNVPNINVIETKDEICTIALQMYIRDGKLNCTGVMRSNDIWLGTPYDVAFFTELQKYIAHRLNVEYGTYTHFVTSLHAYERNLDDIAKTLTCMPTSKLSIDIELLDELKGEIDKLVTHSSKPKEDIVVFCEVLGICKEESYEG